MSRASNAIGLQVLRAAQARQAEATERKRPRRRRRRRLRVNVGRLMFACGILYLIWTGLYGEYHLLQMQSTAQRDQLRLGQIEQQNAQLASRVRYLNTTRGEAQAVQAKLHFVRSGQLPITIHMAKGS